MITPSPSMLRKVQVLVLTHMAPGHGGVGWGEEVPNLPNSMGQLSHIPTKYISI